MDRIILFDGDCNFCDSSVQFIMKRDRRATFKFTSLQSEQGQKLLRKYNVPNDIDSFVIIEHPKCYLKSTAALRVCKQLDGAWKLLSIFLVVPRPIRDFVYDIIAKNRYKWFGTKQSCMIPTAEQRKRFL